MAERHAQIVERLAARYERELGTAARLLFGSLANDTPTPTSDVDLEVITSAGSEWKLEKSEQEGIAVDVVLCPLTHFRRQDSRAALSGLWRPLHEMPLRSKRHLRLATGRALDAPSCVVLKDGEREFF